MGFFLYNFTGREKSVVVSICMREQASEGDFCHVFSLKTIIKPRVGGFFCFHVC
jgi:hypothetical protein